MLTFDELREANVKRCINSFHGLDRWNVAEWGCATAGECGEACNVAKKLRRLVTNPDWKPKDGDLNLTQQLADEIADLIIYADLWAASQGIDLGRAITTKFNRTSAEVGSGVKL